MTQPALPNDRSLSFEDRLRQRGMHPDQLADYPELAAHYQTFIDAKRNGGKRHRRNRYQAAAARREKAARKAG